MKLKTIILTLPTYFACYAMYGDSDGICLEEEIAFDQLANIHAGPGGSFQCVYIEEGYTLTRYTDMPAGWGGDTLVHECTEFTFDVVDMR